MSTRVSIHEIVEIISKDDTNRRADLRGGTAVVEYYESILSPSVSCNITVMDSGGSIFGENSNKLTGIYEGLPIQSLDPVLLRIHSNSDLNQDLDFTSYPLFVNGVSNVDSGNKREFFTLNLVSSNAINNQYFKVAKAYEQSLTYDGIVNKVCQEYLKVTSDRLFIDRSSSTGGALGNMRSPFDFITTLAKKSLPISGAVGNTAGFFFFEPAQGTNFKSIDALVKQEVKAVYYYSEVNRNEKTFTPTPSLPTLDRKIISYKVLKDDNFVSQYARGSLGTQKVFFNPVTHSVSNEGFLANTIEKMPTLGAIPYAQNSLIPGSEQAGFEAGTRIIANATRGTFNTEVSNEEDYDFSNTIAQSKLRYNSIISKVVDLLVPLNTNLYAGDVISIRIPELREKGEATRADLTQIGGRYLIKNLCHRYTSEGSFTKMTLIRDTRGGNPGDLPYPQ